MAAKYMLDFYSAVRFLLEAGEQPGEARGIDFSVRPDRHGGDGCVFAVEPYPFWDIELHGNSNAGGCFAGTIAEESAPGAWLFFVCHGVFPDPEYQFGDVGI